MKMDASFLARRVPALLLLFAGLSVDLPPVRNAGAQEDPPSRTVLAMDLDWRFNRADYASAAMPAFDDSGWRQVNLPHDWSSEGPFSAEYGSGNGYAPGGIAWYRKHFALPSAGLKDRLAAVEFDGVYDHAQVWFNGHFVGSRPYGYASFECDLTPYLQGAGRERPGRPRGSFAIRGFALVHRLGHLPACAHPPDRSVVHLALGDVRDHSFRDRGFSACAH